MLKWLLLGGLALQSAAMFSPARAEDAPARRTFAIGEKDFLLDGKPIQILAGEVHPGRIPHEYWRDRLKMIRAMGLNTVSIYVFWNQHEPRQGEFTFDGDADIAQFVRLAAEEGLWVIVRPGPYVCAEWDFGGYPWWLLKDRDLKIRSKDPRFLKACASYLNALGKQLAPLQVTHGGPILMVQVENEYGSYGSDHEYMRQIRDLERAAGFDVPQFTADGGGHMMAGGQVADALPGLNGGNGPGIMKEIGKYRPQGPWFVPEFYPGWLDHWGQHHSTASVESVVSATRWKLEHNVSFCYYVVHGGTSFGFTTGANIGKGYEPQPTSYDYDAPIDETGRPTKKYFALRELLARHQPPGVTLPDVPKMSPLMAIGPIELTQSVSLFDVLGKPVESQKPLCMEDLDHGNGYVLYRTKLSGPQKGSLKIRDVRDFALVFVGGKRVAVFDRRLGQSACSIEVPKEGATLDILVENCGRINYGGQLLDNRKGITDKVLLSGKELSDWSNYSLPLDRESLPAQFKSGASSEAPVLRRGTFKLETVGDSELDMRGFGKGIVLVNGHNLGRYWYIGPQQTLYLPGCWLKPGLNEIIVFEMLKESPKTIAGITTPILNELHKDEPAFAVKPRPASPPPKLQAVDLVKEGQLKDGPSVQDVTFTPRKGRYLCLQSISSQRGDQFASIAELDVLDAKGQPVPQNGWKIVYVDSEERAAEDGAAENAIDGDAGSKWHTLWEGPHTGHPHTLVIDMGQQHALSGLRYQGRQDENPGRIKAFKFFVSANPF